MASIQRLFTISGMDCGSCAASLTRAISGLPGVGDVEVSFAHARLSLVHDTETTDLARIERYVRQLGFEPALQQPSPPASPAHHPPNHHDHKHDHDHRHAHGHEGCDHVHDDIAPEAEGALTGHTRHFRIDGMDCASCAATITTAIEGLAGVTAASVALAQERLTVTLDTNRPDPVLIEDTIRRLGFGVARLDRAESAPKPWWTMPKMRHLGWSTAGTVAALATTIIAPALAPAAFTAAVAFVGYPIARRAFVAARLGALFTIQMLMTIAAIGAVVTGEPMEALFVVLLFTVGEILEGRAAQKARSGIKALGTLLPKHAWLLDGKAPRKVDADTLRVGQRVLVRPGDRVPTDGTITEGTSCLDESPMTGESVPVSKTVGADVFAGTVNHDAALTIKVTRPTKDNTIARIIAMVEEAQDAKAPTERFIERFSRVYMPIVIALAVAVALVPPLLTGADWMIWAYRALALLLIGCPCALVISVPAAIASALAAGAGHGILIKGGAVMESIAQVGTVIFDKTGTLTEGAPQVTDVIPLSGPGTDDVLALAFGVEQGASHPLAEAICAHARAEGVAAQAVEDLRLVPGKGMEATQDGQPVFVGAPGYASERIVWSQDVAERIQDLEAQGKTLAMVIRGPAVLGLIALRDEPRPESAETIRALTERGIKAFMMTGDNQRAAEATARPLGLVAEAGMLPEHKAARVAERAALQTVMMVGDGVNDAPALAQAQVGVAIGSGADVAMEAADAALMRNDIGDVARMIDLARKTMRNVHQNVALALGLKALFLITTVTGLSGLWMAVLADTGATVLVTANAMRLLGALGPRRPAPVTAATRPRLSPAS